MKIIPAAALEAMTLAEIRAVLDLGPEETRPWLEDHDETSARLDEAARALRSDE